MEAPIVGASGSDLPALLGLRSMRAKGAVLEMTPGKEYLTFPGPGGYKIDWSPGTLRFRLEQAPSGHLIIPCGAFNRLGKQEGGLPHRPTTFHATPADAHASQTGTGGGAPSAAGRPGTGRPTGSGAGASRIGTGGPRAAPPTAN